MYIDYMAVNIHHSRSCFATVISAVLSLFRINTASLSDRMSDSIKRRVSGQVLICNMPYFKPTVVRFYTSKILLKWVLV